MGAGKCYPGFFCPSHVSSTPTQTSPSAYGSSTGQGKPLMDTGSPKSVDGCNMSPDSLGTEDVGRLNLGASLSGLCICPNGYWCKANTQHLATVADPLSAALANPHVGSAPGPTPCLAGHYCPYGLKTQAEANQRSCLATFWCPAARWGCGCLSVVVAMRSCVILTQFSNQSSGTCARALPPSCDKHH